MSHDSLHYEDCISLAQAMYPAHSTNFFSVSALEYDG